MIDTQYATVRRGGLAAALAGVLLGAALVVAAPAAPARADSHTDRHNDRHAQSHADQRDDNRNDRRNDRNDRNDRRDNRNDRRDNRGNENRGDRRSDAVRNDRDGNGTRADEPSERNDERRGGPRSSRQATVADSETGSAAALGIRARLGDDVDIAEGRAAYPGDQGEDKLAAVTLGEVGTAHTVTATATGEASSGETRAEAGVAELDIDLAEMRLGSLSSGEIRAACLAEDGMTPRGAAVLTDAVLSLPWLPDVEFGEAPAPNTTIRLPGHLGQAVLNEQSRQPNGSLTVNALHLTLNDRTGTRSGELVVGSVNCLAGTGEEEEEKEEEAADDATRDEDEDRNADEGGTRAEDDTARFVAAAEDARTGRAVHGVLMEIVQPNGETAADCTTDSSGTCAIEDLPPGTYYVCVANVPWRYQMPERDEVCSGPYEAEAGQEIRMERPFGVERSQFA
ncbi:choice-of-anchor P family protein [Streptomyces sp. 6N223]|uniref:choice-of-anchor P family protein n=1 Tax=Streptomyces sp. 6N223 TaxID=3457412 RepID=UPI003FD2B961